MSLTPIDMDIAAQHRTDLLREAEHVRRLDIIHLARLKTMPHAPALAWVGEQLIAWGWRLRARYGALEMGGSAPLIATNTRRK